MILIDVEFYYVDLCWCLVVVVMEVVFEGGLCGVVSNVKAIILCLFDVIDVWDSGLFFVIYGEGNDDVVVLLM